MTDSFAIHVIRCRAERDYQGGRDEPHAPSDVKVLLAEVDRLTRWKAEASSLFDGLQDLGRALALPLGELITGPAAVEAATSLRARVESLEADVVRLAAERDDLRMTESILRGEIRRSESALATFDDVNERRIAAEARLAAVEALADLWDSWDGTRPHPGESSPRQREQLRTALATPEARTGGGE